MNEKVVVAAIVIIIASAIAVAVTASKFESYARFGDIDMKLEAVNDSHAVVTFVTEVRKENVEEFAIKAKIYDIQTDLLLNELEETFKSPESRFTAELTIPFEKTRDYKIVLYLQVGDRIYDSYRLTLRNLRNLVSEDMKLEASLVDSDFLLTSVKNGSVGFVARFYVESVKDYDVVARIKVLQADSNVLVGESWKNVTLQKGKTNIVSAEFEVPDDYNYVVKLDVWRNGKLVKSWADVLNLAPTKKLSKGEVEKEVDFEAEKFVTAVEPEYVPKSGGVPGFEVVFALMALAGVALWRKARR
ncbi:DUF7490 domain-containing protein [Archaeoglobus fulgidus]|jgi:hypothetical protein|uniref:PGF-CTERM sorting domain-containing protein n=3 Tax=Archaeoglobus fulgidus TaxID=2234 RepID=O28123_ARCFU|nr:PGF-CTERM sorting domain-containing protein [Archaeoglobus fulgidus]AAB89100.1 predicted coding region AF_2159 [Archaeoglobus fulgidus DSM 4304]AIG99146.1 hypothetical protein AFULGI_00024290 [Archaeoglobus fulgidus DSM 8774]KUJ92964.1 MAG: hypothetical protein XD40_1835 [Archaeoglobus fulgidus]KUK06449.1 MAG: hypothetical protein XD48_1322 [Archaeoglobus fulgidus]